MIARTLPEARRLLEQMRPVAIVLDIRLAGEDTWAFIGEVRRREESRSDPLVVVSSIDDQAKGLALGADAYAIKPVHPSWLLGTLNRLLERGADRRVLVIDDDEISRYLVRNHLAGAPFVVTEAGDPRQGLLEARARRPDAIVLDLAMPEMSGFDVLDRLKEDPATMDIPVVILTSKALTDDERRRLAPHARRILSKQALATGDEAEHLRAALSGEAPRGEPRGRILNVDDYEASRYARSQMLVRSGFQVTEAGTGADALRLAEEQRPDLVLLDVNLPDMDGFEVCRRLRAQQSTMTVPIVHISATFLSDKAAELAYEGGADSYLTDPVEPAVLLATIHSLLRLRRAEEDLRAASRGWQATFDAIGDGICLLSPEGTVARCNGALAALLGASSADVVGPAVGRGLAPARGRCRALADRAGGAKPSPRDLRSPDRAAVAPAAGGSGAGGRRRDRAGVHRERRHHRAAGRRRAGRAVRPRAGGARGGGGQQPGQGRVPGHARPRAAQPARRIGTAVRVLDPSAGRRPGGGAARARRHRAPGRASSGAWSTTCWTWARVTTGKIVCCGCR